MTREEAIKYAEDKFSKGLYRLDLGYLNRGLYQITAKEVDFLRVAIAALRKQPCWIPVTERLPEPMVDVIAYDSNWNEPFAAYMTRHKDWVGVVCGHKVTHWMPLPDGPEEES